MATQTQEGTNALPTDETAEAEGFTCFYCGGFIPTTGALARTDIIRAGYQSRTGFVCPNPRCRKVCLKPEQKKAG